MMHSQNHIKCIQKCYLNFHENPTNGLAADARSQTKRQTDKQTNIRVLSLYNALLLVLKKRVKNEYVIKRGTQSSSHISVNGDSRSKPLNTRTVRGYLSSQPYFIIIKCKFDSYTVKSL